MNKRIGVVSIILLAIGLSACSARSARTGWVNTLKPKGKPGPALTLTSKGKALYAVVIPTKPTTQEQKASSELSIWLEKMTGAKFSVVKEASNQPIGSKVISIGNTNLLREASLPESSLDLGRDGYAIAVRGNNLFLLGGSKRGPINAVYALLEEDLGCRWYDKICSVVPKGRNLKFRPVPRHFVPALVGQRQSAYYEAYNLDWALRNRTNPMWEVIVPDEWGGSVQSIGLVHTAFMFIPPSEYFSTHPEYFSEINGVRKPTQLCLTNPDVINLMTEKVRQAIKARPWMKMVSVSHNDGGGYCDCANCKAVDEAEGSRAGSLLKFVNAVADTIGKEFPDEEISTLAYLQTAKPPKTIRPRPNVVIQLCTDAHTWKYPFLPITDTNEFQDIMKSWEAIGAKMDIWDYTMNYSQSLLPMPNMPVVSQDIRFFVKHHARGVLQQGNYWGDGAENAALRCWVWAKQLWDPSLDTRTLMKDFIYGYYGTAAEEVWKYNQMLWNIWEVNYAKPHAPGTPVTVNPLMIERGIGYMPDVPFLKDKFVEDSLKLFAIAEKKACDESTLQKVRRAKLPVVYLRVCRLLGFYNQDDKFVIGSAVASKDTSKYAECNTLLSELKIIIEAEKVARFSESTTVPGGSNKFGKWDEVLGEIKPK